MPAASRSTPASRSPPSRTTPAGSTWWTCRRPTTPRLIQTINAAANLLEVADGIVYATVGSDLQSYDLATGQAIDTLSFPGVAFTGMAREGEALYLMDTADVLRVVDIDGGSLVARGSLTMPQGGGGVFVGDGIAYVAATDVLRGGYATADVSAPDDPKLISGTGVPVALAEPGGAIAANGSGLALEVGRTFSGVGAVDELDSSDPTNTFVFLTRFTTPSAPVAVTLSSGIAVVADGSSGLLVVNYVPFDTKGVAPTVTIGLPPSAVVSPAGAPPQVVEGSIVPIVAGVSDDVQVRNVELLVNGQVVQESTSFPFNLALTAPLLTATATTFTVQVRATDTGGNTTLSAPLVVSLAVDTQPPALVGSTPSEGGKSFFIPAIDLRFDKALDPSALNLAGITLTNLGADGQVGGGDDVTVAVDPPLLLGAGRLVSLAPAAPLTPGNYRLTLDPAILADDVGNHVTAPVVLDFNVRAASTTRAASGTPANPAEPSANPGQAIALTGTGLNLQTAVTFATIDANGNPGQSTVFPAAVAADGTTLTVIVPDLAATGPVLYQGDDNDTPTTLQIVPVVSGLDFGSVSSDGSTPTVTVTLTGKGFIEGHDTVYSLGGVSVPDPDPASGPQVLGNANAEATLTLPLSDAAYGAVTVTTAGGTSAPFGLGVISLAATAYSGTPADASQPSANPGQVVTLSGTGLTATTDIVVQYIQADTNAGTTTTILLHPNFVDAGGTRATFVVPSNLNGAFPVHVAGSASAPILQIVPIVDSVDETRVSTNLRGAGFVAGHDSVYQAGTATLTDTGVPSYQFTVDETSNSTVSLEPPPPGGPGMVRVTTAGGTSAPIPWNVLYPLNEFSEGMGTISALTFDPSSGAAVILDQSSQIRWLDPATGADTRPPLPDPVALDLVGNSLQVLPRAITLGGTVVPAGSLLSESVDPSDTRQLAAAFDPTTGAALATVLVNDRSQDASQIFSNIVFDPASGHLFATDNHLDGSGLGEILEINPVDGTILDRFMAPFTTNEPGGASAGALAVDPVSGDLWLNGYEHSGNPQLVEVTPAGAVVRRVSLTTQGFNNEGVLGFGNFASLAFDATGRLFGTTPSGVWPLNLNPTPPPDPTLTAIAAVADDGTPADPAAASANAGQVIELTGTNFRRSDLQVVFPTRDNNGVVSEVAVAPAAISADGTRAQVVVPNLATSGVVTINTVGSNAGKDVSYTNGDEIDIPTKDNTAGIYRDVTVLFTPSASSTQLTFNADLAVPYFSLGGNLFFNESWGLDNVRVAPAAAPANVVFQDDFEAGASSAWSSPTTDQSDTGTFSRFSGEFVNQSQTLTLGGLQAGQSYRLQFDLYTFNNWQGTTPGNGEDDFNVFADGQPLFHEAFSNSTANLQTYRGYNAASLPLQIVPVITGEVDTVDSADGEASFTLLGSGFMKGGSNVTVGGAAVDLTAGSLGGAKISGARNDTYAGLIAPGGIDGPVQITTAGGSSQAPAASPAAATVFNGIEAMAGQGTPADATQASANAGQSILLTGGGFVASTAVEFTAVDDAGVVGTVARTGVLLANGTLRVTVPNLARTGPVRVVGASGQFLLQVVPTLQAVGGPLKPGGPAVLEGSGLAPTAAGLAIDGQPVATYQVQTFGDGGPIAQLIDLTVPAGAGAGVVTVTTTGGTFTFTPGSITAINAPGALSTPTRASLAFANPGQSITLIGMGFSANDQVVFSTINATSNQVSSTVATPISVAPDGTSLVCLVPFDAATGVVRLARETAGILLQVVAVVAAIGTDVNSPAATAAFHGQTLVLYGTGFVKGLTIHYGLPGQPGASTSLATSEYVDPTTQVLGLVTTVPSGAPLGPISVSGLGGASATFQIILGQVVATAASGTPANPALPSANPGQTITVQGAGFSALTSLVVPTIGANGVVGERVVRPLTVSPAGDTLTAVVPDDALTGPIGIVGDGHTIVLQIVPVVESAALTGVQRVRVIGKGLIEGNDTIYRFGSGIIVDSATDAAPTDVSNTNTTADLPLPVGGNGSLTVTTAGGTSAPIPWDVITPAADFRSDLATSEPDFFANDELAGVAVTANGDLFVSTTSEFSRTGSGFSTEFHRIDPTTGNIVTLLVAPPDAEPVALQILPTAMTLGGVHVPAGSLLVFAIGGNFPGSGVTGEVDSIAAVDPNTGVQLALLLVPRMSSNGTGDSGTPQAGVFDPTTGHFLVFKTGTTTAQMGHIDEIDPATGATLSSIPVPLMPDYSGGGLAIDPSTGDLWVGATTSTQVVEVTRTGTVVRTVDLASRGIVSSQIAPIPENGGGRELISGEIGGLAFNASGQLLVSSRRGVVYLVNLP